MRVHSIVLEIKDIEEYLKTQGGPFNLNSKDQELAVALILARFYKKQHGGEYMIGIPAKREHTYKYDFNNIEILGEMINYCVEEDTPIDISIIPKDSIKLDRKIPPKGFAFQLKRISIEHENPQEAGLIIADYLNEVIPKKYSSVEHCTLVLIVGSKEEYNMLDLGKVRDIFKPQNFPFSAVMFVMAQANKIIIGEFWPNFGREEYPLQDWLNDN